MGAMGRVCVCVWWWILRWKRKALALHAGLGKSRGQSALWSIWTSHKCVPSSYGAHNNPFEFRCSLPFHVDSHNHEPIYLHKTPHATAALNGKSSKADWFFCLNGRRLLFLTFLSPITPPHKHFILLFKTLQMNIILSKRELAIWRECSITFSQWSRLNIYFRPCMFITYFSLIIFRRWPWSNIFSTWHNRSESLLC